MTAPFVFGKLPGHGDFVVRGLDVAAQAAWDGAATRLMQDGQDRLGDRFAAAHAQGPPWRFILGPGSMGPDWRVGVLAPSQDAVGRRFVLVLGYSGLIPAAGLAPGALDQLEDLAYAAIGQHLGVDELLERMRTLNIAGESAAPELSEQWWTLDVEGHVALRHPAAEPPAGLLTQTFAISGPEAP